MAKNNNLKDYLTDLYEGIASKKTNPSRNPQDFRQEIESIETGVDTSDGTATASDILKGKTAYVKDEKVTGSIETYDYSVDDGGEVVPNRFAQNLRGELTEITLNDLEGSVRLLPYFIAANSKIEKLEIPNTVTNFWQNAFSGTYSSITINNLYYYGTLSEWLKISMASGNSTGLDTTPLEYTKNFFLQDEEGNFYEPSEELIIPSDIEIILRESLSDFKKVTSINLNNVNELKEAAIQFSSYNDKKLTRVYGGKVTKISGSYALTNNKLESVEFPNLISIYARSFSACNSLKKVLIEQTDSVCTLSNKNAFEYCNHILGTTDSTYNPDGLKDGYIYVPASLLSQYKVATNWATYETQIIGHQNFNVGDTLPSYTNETFTTQTWYSDETLTQVVTSVATAGRYYCRLEV